MGKISSRSVWQGGRALQVVVLAIVVLFATLAAGRGTAQPASPASPDALWFAEADGQVRVRLYFFHSTTCPHCVAAMPVLRGIMAARPWLEVEWLEIGEEDSQRLFLQLARQFGREPEAVPSFFVCREMLVGFDSAATTGEQLAALADHCHNERLGRGTTASKPVGEATAQKTGRQTIDLPFAGRMDADKLSLPALTLVLAGLDAFNPCAFFVLLFLLSFLAHARSRGRMALVGGLFVAVSGVMYFLFMAAWLNLFLLLQHAGWITLLAGLVALVIGALGVKDYFYLGEGPSLSIPSGAKPSLYRRMGQISGEERLGVLLGGTALLAITANMYELLCTSGFPLVYTSVLTRHELSPSGRYAWLAAYNAVYVLPLLVIVGLFVATLGARKLSEREGRLLKLVSGLMMLGLGLTLVLAPQLLTNVLTALLLLVGAVALTALIARYAQPR